jgi:hypothetical protein
MTTISDAPSCCITYSCHSDDFRVVIYDRNIFIVQATGVNFINILHKNLNMLINFENTALELACKG